MTIHPGRILVSALVGMLILFTWGYVWFIASPLAARAIKPMPEAAATLVEGFRSLCETGAFYAPRQRTATEPTQRGPIIVLASAGFVTNLPPTFPIGMTHYFISALALSLAAVALKDSLTTWGRRVAFFGGAGAFVGLYGRLFLPVWYDAPWDFFWFLAANDVLGWLLAGTIMAFILKAR